jgi:hypothetical protein
MQELKAAFDVCSHRNPTASPFRISTASPFRISRAALHRTSHAPPTFSQVFVPKAQREKVDPKILVAFLTQVYCTPQHIAVCDRTPQHIAVCAA